MVICLGGAIGTGLRYVTSGVAARWLGADFPYGTLIVNVVGSFLIGLIQHVGTASLLIPETTRLFLTVGIMGGLTTYSSFSYETIRLAQVGAWGQAWVNVLVTTSLCLGVCFLGIAAGRLIVGVRV
ncbi:MAG: fluoride efflux transporter CrcB [Candidatus Rokuibacteriota bacterium]|nr:MAG: fluoride efflux transporter CrcB [Candidatus Rokubacteria bacterium]